MKKTFITLLMCLSLLLPVSVFAETEEETAQTEESAESTSEIASETNPASEEGEEGSETETVSEEVTETEEETPEPTAAPEDLGILSAAGFDEAFYARGEDAQVRDYTFRYLQYFFSEKGVPVTLQGEAICADVPGERTDAGYVVLAAPYDIPGASATQALFDALAVASFEKAGLPLRVFLYPVAGQDRREALASSAAFMLEDGAARPLGIIELCNMALGDHLYIYATEYTDVTDMVFTACKRAGVSLFTVAQWIQKEKPDCFDFLPKDLPVPYVMIEKSAWATSSRGGGNTETFATRYLQSSNSTFSPTGGRISGTAYDSYRYLSSLGPAVIEDDLPVLSAIASFPDLTPPEPVTETPAPTQPYENVRNAKRGLDPLTIVIIAVCIIGVAAGYVIVARKDKQDREK